MFIDYFLVSVGTMDIGYYMDIMEGEYDVFLTLWAMFLQNKRLIFFYSTQYIPDLAEYGFSFPTTLTPAHACSIFRA